MRSEDLGDPLSNVARKQRKGLMLSSVVGIVAITTGLIPKEISTFGIRFSESDQRTIELLNLSVVAYFMIAFLLYAGADFMRYRLGLLEAIISYEKSQHKELRESEYRPALSAWHESFEHKELKLYYDRTRFFIVFARPIVLLRFVYDFILPVILGLIAVIYLV